MLESLGNFAIGVVCLIVVPFTWHFFSQIGDYVGAAAVQYAIRLYIQKFPEDEEKLLRKYALRKEVKE